MHDDNVKVVKWLDNRQCMHRGIEYPIVLSEDLLSDMKSIVTVASNASSTDGFGYYSGWLYRCLVFRTLCEEVGWGLWVHIFSCSAYHFGTT